MQFAKRELVAKLIDLGDKLIMLEFPIDAGQAKNLVVEFVRDK